MALTVETGAIVPGANTYVDDATFTAYAAARGLTIPATAPAREVLLIKAMDYLETLDRYFLGYRYKGIDQPLLWPRSSVYFGNILFPYTSIPAELKKAQMVIAIATQTIELFPAVSGSSAVATRKTVGPITIEYSGASPASSLMPIISQANALLRILYGNGGQLRVSRA